MKSTRSEFGGKVPRILVVDDTPDNLFLMNGLFEDRFRVQLAASGAEALRASRFDVVLMDLDSLGDLASPPADAVARLVKLAEGALTLAISDGSSVSANLEVMRAGAHDCLTRPFAASVLAARIAELSRRHGTARMRGLADAPPPDAAVAFEGSRAVRRPVLPMWRQEQRIIEEAIASFSGNISLAAQALELSPSTIYRKRQHWAEAEDKRGAA